jgi:hypothetical protein
VANATNTTLSYLLKTIYPYGLASVGYEDSPALAMVKKRTDFAGENVAIPLRYANQTGRSASFARAKALKNPSSGKKFLLTLARDYCFGGIDALSIKTARDKGAIDAGLQAEIESMAYSESRSIASSLFRDGGGVIGVIGSGAGTPTITLATPDDIVNFEVGMTIDGSTTPGVGGVAITGGVGAVISAIDRISGTITTTGGVNWNAATAINGIANGNYLFQSGDYGSKLSGFAAWVPSTAPGATAFFGVDRTADVTRLGGLRITAESTIEETLLKGISLLGREGGKPDTVFLHPLDLKDLVIALGSKVVYTSVDLKAPQIGFEAVKLIGSTGPVRVVGDLNCPRGKAFILQMNTWTLWSAGDLIHTVDDDTLKMLRDSDSDSVEIRMRSYSQLACSAPGYNAVATLPVEPLAGGGP